MHVCAGNEGDIPGEMCKTVQASWASWYQKITNYGPVNGVQSIAGDSEVITNERRAGRNTNAQFLEPLTPAGQQLMLSNLADAHLSWVRTPNCFRSRRCVCIKSTDSVSRDTQRIGGITTQYPLKGSQCSQPQRSQP